MITRLFPVLRFFMLLCLMGWGNAILSGQNYQDSLPPGETYGLRLLSFQVEEDNYSGFEDGSEKKLNKAVKALNDKLSSSAQAGFKAYDLGLYRILNSDVVSFEKEIESFVNQVKLASQYYFVTVKIWVKDKDLSDLRVYFNLPSNLPAFDLYSQEQAQEIFVEFLIDSYRKRNSNPSRVKEAQAEGIKGKGIDFLFDEREYVPMDGISMSTLLDESNIYTYNTPTGQQLALPGGFKDKVFLKCDDEHNIPGALVGFKLGGNQYWAWWSQADKVIKGYSRKDPSNPNKPLGYVENLFTGYENSIDENNIHIGISETNGAEKYTQIKRGKLTETKSVYKNGVASGFKRTILKDIQDVPNQREPYTGACFTLKGFPLISMRDDFKELKPWAPLSEQEKTNINGLNYTEGCNFLDLTGRLSELKSALTDYNGNVVDIVVSSSNTPATALNNLTTALDNLNPLQKRAVIWVHIGSDGVPRRKVVAPQSFVSPSKKASADIFFDRVADKALVKAENVSNGVNPELGPLTGNYSLFNLFGIGRLLFTTAHEFLENARLSDPKYWDADSGEYFLRESSNFFPLVKATGLDNLIAIGCGSGTAVVDAAIGVLDQAESINNALEFIFDSEARAKALDNLSQTIEDIKNPAMRQFIFAMLKKELLKEVKEFGENEYKRFYYAGYFPTQIIVGILSASGTTKLLNAFDTKTGYRNKIKKVQDIARRYAPKTPNVGEILGKIFKSEKYDIVENNGQVTVKVGNSGAEIMTINENGKLPSKPVEISINEYRYGGTIEVENGSKAMVVNTSTESNPNWVVIPVDEIDDLIQRIMERQGIDFNSENRKRLREGFVAKIDSKYTSEFTAGGKFENIFDNLAIGSDDKLDFFSELAISFNANKGLGVLFASGKLDQWLIKSWHKIKQGGLPDFKDKTGYLETLQKMATYEKNKGGGGVVKYYRVQGGGSGTATSKELLSVESNGNLTFNDPNVDFNISTDNKDHALYYLNNQRPNGQIVEFEVPKWLDDQMKSDAIPQYKSTKNLLNVNLDKPKLVDPTQVGNPFELPSNWHSLIKDNYIKGSGKIIN